MTVSYWEWLNRDKALSCCLALRLVLKVSARLLGAKQRLIKGDSSRQKIHEVLAARMRKLITTRARKNKRTARILADARKDHSIPLQWQRVVMMLDRPR